MHHVRRNISQCFGFPIKMADDFCRGVGPFGFAYNAEMLAPIADAYAHPAFNVLQVFIKLSAYGREAAGVGGFEIKLFGVVAVQAFLTHNRKWLRPLKAQVSVWMIGDSVQQIINRITP